MLIKQIYAVFWKHAKVRQRHFILSILELFLPITIFVIIAYARYDAPRFERNYVSETHPIKWSYDDLIYSVDIYETKIFYTPKTEFTDSLIRQVQLKIDLQNDAIKGFQTRDDLLRYYKEIGDEGITVAVVFDNVGHTTPKDLKYDVQMYQEGIDWQTDKLLRNDIQYIEGVGSEKYISNQFTAIQWAIDVSYIEMLTKKSFNASMTFQEFPHPAHWTDNGMNDLFIHVLPSLTVLSFIFLFSSLLKLIVEERSSGIRQLMKINGLKSWIYWMGWYINGLIFCAISVVFITVFLKTKIFDDELSVLEHAPAIQIVVLLLLYCSATISFIFAFSKLFNGALFAMIIGIVFWYIVYIAFLGAAVTVDVMSIYMKIILSLIPNIALYFGFEIFSVGEIRGNTVALNEKPRNCNDELSMLNVYTMLIVDTIFYFSISLLSDSDVNGNYKLVKYWRSLRDNLSAISNRFNNKIPIDENNNFIKKEPLIGESCGTKSDVPYVDIRNLTKRYGPFKTLDELSMKIYEGKLTALLGANGAGKTTLMSILAGLIHETSGEVIFNVQSEIKRKNRQDVSICPQHNLLLPEFTVKQHLQFFGLLKGMSKPEIKEELKTLLDKKLQLSDKKNELVKNLSGGMKRKLSIGIAILGKPKLLILDEPTAGIDAEGRRRVWELIKTIKGETTILMSTHLMEEAEQLADYVAIIDDGKMEKFGSLMDLKKSYGIGYSLEIKCESDDDRCKELDEIICKKFAAIKRSEDKKNKRLSYHFNTEQQKYIPNFIKEIQESADYTIKSTSLEDIFNGIQREKETSNKGKETSIEINSDRKREQSKFCLLITLTKKLAFIKRTYLIWLLSVLAFYVLMALSIYLSNNGYKNITKEGKTFQLQLDSYGCTRVFYSVSGSFDEEFTLPDIYEQLINEYYGVPHISDDVSKSIVDMGTENIVEYKTRMTIATEFVFEEKRLRYINVMYSNQAIHGAPISLNIVTNTLLRYLTGEEHTITTTNTPLRSVTAKRQYTIQSMNDNLIVWLTMFPLSLLFIVVVFVHLPTAEKTSLVKTLSKIFGLSSPSYWLNNYIIDVICYFTIITPAVVILYILSCVEIITIEPDAILRLTLIISIYGVTMIPFTYLISTFANSVSGAYATFFIPSMCLSTILASILLVLNISKEQEKLRDVLGYIFFINPHVMLTYLSSKFCSTVIENHNWDIKTPGQRELICEEKPPLPCCVSHSKECADHRSYIAWTKYSTITVVAALFCVILVIMQDCNWFKKLFTFSWKYTYTSDNDPKKGIKFVMTKIRKVYTKYFGLWKLPSVEDLSIDVKEGQCLGLLGVNGAGKSTAFKMITKQEFPTSGTIETQNVSSEGFCPQDHAMLCDLSGRELLTYFADLMNADVENVDKYINSVGLKNPDKPCRSYSGGNKRKLNTCIALIGSSNVVLLDEPTAGVDPVSRKKIQDLILECKKKSAVIFTSHSMDECEKICDKLAIMRKGKIVEGTNSTVSELKKAYNVGHIVQYRFDFIPEERAEEPNSFQANVKRRIKLMRSISEIEQSEKNLQLEKVLNYLKSTYLGNLDILDKKLDKLEVRVRKSTWKRIFEENEFLKEKYDIKFDYYVKESSLEDAFLAIAESIDTEDEEDEKKKLLEENKDQSEV